MEKRAVLALLLCAVVVIFHYMVVAPLIERPPKPAPKETQAAEAPKGDEKGEPTRKQPETPEKPVPAEKPETPEKPQTPEKPETPETPEKPVPVTADAGRPAYRPKPVAKPIELKRFTLKNEKLTTTWTNAATGACLDVTFNEFYETVKKQKLFRILGTFEEVTLADWTRRAPRTMTVAFPGYADSLAEMPMEVVSTDNDTLTFARTIQQHVGEGEYRDYLRVTKTVAFATDPKGNDAYELRMKVDLENLSTSSIKTDYTISVIEGLAIEKTASMGESARYAYLGEDELPILKEQKLSGFTQRPWSKESGALIWAGVDDRYFAALLLVDDFKDTLASARFDWIWGHVAANREPTQTLGLKVTTAPIDVQAGATQSRTYRLYVGPKKTDVLEQYYTYGLPDMIDFGMFGFISHIVIWILRGFQLIVRNWGVAIILLTMLIRVLLHPLTKKSQVAMHKMQRLKPKIQELQKKYKNDRQKLGQEQMKLFREHGVSPFSGCLPMLLQLPILIALFWGLRLTFELRQASFMLWITDLSIPDTVGKFSRGIPLIGGANINILPILMTVSMFLQQRMMPKSDDPQAQQQQKMMMFMPFMFLFFFYGFPSGLCLYWFTSTMVGMGEQYFIKRHLAAEPDAVPVKASSSKSKRRK